MPKFSIKMEIKVRTVKLSTAPGLLQYCAPGQPFSVRTQDQDTVQDACERYLTHDLLIKYQPGSGLLPSNITFLIAGLSLCARPLTASPKIKLISQVHMSVDVTHLMNMEFFQDCRKSMQFLKIIKRSI